VRVPPVCARSHRVEPRGAFLAPPCRLCRMDGVVVGQINNLHEKENKCGVHTVSARTRARASKNQFPGTRVSSKFGRWRGDEHRRVERPPDLRGAIVRGRGTT
jgi:hypothetical protein